VLRLAVRPDRAGAART